MSLSTRRRILAAWLGLEVASALLGDLVVGLSHSHNVSAPILEVMQKDVLNVTSNQRELVLSDMYSESYYYYPSFDSDEADFYSVDPALDSSQEEYYELTLDMSEKPIDTIGVLPLPTPMQMDMSMEDSHKDFEPLMCNAALQSANPATICTTKLSTFLSSSSTTKDAYGRLVIPCGTCVVVDSAPGSTTEIPQGINVEGMLYVPSNAYGRNTEQPTILKVTSIFIQGIWTIDPPQYINLNEPTKIFKVLMFGGDRLHYFQPHPQNAMACHMDKDMGNPEPVCALGKKPIVVAGGRVNFHGYSDPELDCVSWVKIHDMSTDLRTITMAPRTNETGVPNLTCWRPGDELIMTSPDMNFKFAHAGIVESVNHTTGQITLTPNTTAPEWFAFASEVAALRDDGDARLATEVMKLTRPISFEAMRDDPTNEYNHGAHFIIYHTPTSPMAPPQYINGLDVSFFGQQGILGRYPIHFHMCADVSGALLQSNTVRNSFQRGYVVHGSHNVTLVDNVGYEISGHCYFLEDGIETGNVFRRNIGSHIRRPTFRLPSGPGQTDHNPTVFWCSNAQNYWYHNVAAGSVASGFWFETARQINGPSAHLASFVPQFTLLGDFKDNIAHSTTQRGIQMYSPGWRPPQPCTLRNSVVFRARWDAFMIHNNINVTLSGGLIADSGTAILNFRAASNIVENFDIIGYSKNYANVRSKTLSWGYSPKEHIRGVTYHSWNICPYSTFGMIYRNLRFRRFSNYETDMHGGENVIIYQSVHQSLSYFDNPMRWVNNTIDHGPQNSSIQELDACKAPESGVNGVFFEDVKGTLTAAKGMPGFFVSDNYRMTAFTARDTVTGKCESLPSACLAFCGGACLRQTTFMVSNAPLQAPIEMLIRPSPSTDSGIEVPVPWVQHQFKNSTFDLTNYRADGKFSAVLPQGNYEIEFRNKYTLEPAWPDYVEDYLEDAPFCNPDLKHNFTIIVPEWTEERCGQLIRGGGADFEDGTWGNWQQSLTEFGLVSPGYAGSEYALHVSNRQNALDSVSMYIDVSCLVAAQIYEFSARIRLEVLSEPVTCDPTTPLSCPIASIWFYEWFAQNKTSINSSTMNLALVKDDQTVNGFYLLRGLIMFTQRDVDSTRAQIRIAYPEAVDYIIDDVSFKPFVPPIIVDTLTPTPNILSPNDVITVIGGSTLGSDAGISKAIDGTTAKTMIQMNKEYDSPTNQDSPAGFQVFPVTSRCSVANGIRIFVANDRFGNDPATLQILGRKALNDPWKMIATQDWIALPQDRNNLTDTGAGLDISTTAGLLSKYIPFNNTESFTFYRVLFPSTKNQTGFVHVAEVQLSGYYCPSNYVPQPVSVPPVVSPEFPKSSVVNVAYLKPTWQNSINKNGDSARAVDGNTNGIWVGETTTYSLSGSTWQVNLQSELYIQEIVIWKRIDDCCLDVLANFALELMDANHVSLKVIPHRPLVALNKDHIVFDIKAMGVFKAQYIAVHAWSGNILNLAEVQVFAPKDLNYVVDIKTNVENVLSPNDIVSGWGYRAVQGPRNALDGRGSKWTVDLTVPQAKAQLEVIPNKSSCTVVKGIRVYTNDKDVTADPTGFVVEGRGGPNDVAEWSLIAQGSLSLPLQRNNATTNTMTSTTAYYDYKGFSNLKAYNQYRIAFPTNKGGNITEIAEVQLSGTICNEDFEHSPTAAPTMGPTMNPENVCVDLIPFNGNAQAHPMLPRPFERSYDTAPWPVIANEGSNAYFRISGRTRWVDGLTLYISPACVRNDWPYVIQFRYRMLTTADKPMLARVRVDYQLKGVLTWENGVLDLTCGTPSVGQWVDCSIMTDIRRNKDSADLVRINFWSNGDGTDTTTLDFDDVKFALYEPENKVISLKPVTNILSPIDLIYPINYDGIDRGHKKAIDGKLDKVQLPISAQTPIPGLEITPVSSKCTVVNGITLFVGDVQATNDPAQIQVLGRNDPKGNWTTLLDQMIALPQERNPSVGNITGSSALKKKWTPIKNNQQYKYYRVLFPQLKQPGGDNVQFAEVQMTGYYCPEEYIPIEQPSDPPVVPKYFDRGSVVNVAYGKMATQTTTMVAADASRAVDGNINPYASGQSIALTGAGASWTVDLKEMYHIQEIVIYKRMDDCCIHDDVTQMENFAIEFLDASFRTVHLVTQRSRLPSAQATYRLNVASNTTVIAQFVAIHQWGNRVLSLAEVQVLAPMMIAYNSNASSSEHSEYVDNFLRPRDIVTSFARRVSEGPANAIDGKGNKFAVNTTESKSPLSIEIVPTISSCTVVKEIRVFTADFKPDNDPKSYTLEGKNKETAHWEIISQGNLTLPLQRNALTTIMNPTSAFSQYVRFSNLHDYYQYRVSFPGPNRANTDITEIGEIQMSGIICGSDFQHAPTAAPTPASTISKDEHCKDLIFANGDANNSPTMTTPFGQSYSTAPFPRIVKDATTGNQYFSIQQRTRWVDGMTINVDSKCIRSDWPYVISFKYRLSSSTPMAARVRMDYQDIQTGEWIKSVVDVACPQKSKSDWVNCQVMTQINMSDDPSKQASVVSINFWSDGDGTDTFNLDFDDISFSLYQPPVVSHIMPVKTILSQKDLIKAIGGTTMGSDFGIGNVLDGTIANSTLISFEGNVEPGFEVVPVQAKCTIANNIRIFAPIDKARNDPTQVKLYARNSLTSSWTILADSLLAIPQERNPMTTTLDAARYYKNITFSNNRSFKYYRVTFPQIKTPGTILQLAEVQLSGYLCPDDYVEMPLLPNEPRAAPIFDPATVVNVAFGKHATQTGTMSGGEASRAVDGNINAYTSGLSVALTAAGGTWEVNLEKEYDIQQVVIWKRMDDCCLDAGMSNFALEFMNAKLETVHVLPYRGSVPLTMEAVNLDVSAQAIRAQYVAIHAWGWTAMSMAEVQVFAPMMLSYVSTEKSVTNVLSSTDIVAGWGRKSDEGPKNAIDQSGSVWNVDLFGGRVPSIEIVPTASSCTVVKGIRVFTGDSDEMTDPKTFKLEGIAPNSKEWQIIAMGNLTLPSQRNALTAAMDPSTAFSQLVKFSNIHTYFQYRVSFPTNKGGAYTKVGDIHLSGMLCPKDFQHAPTAVPTAAPTMNTESVCDNLIFANGKAEDSPVLTIPFEQTYSTAPIPQIVKDSTGNQYFRVADRSRWVDGLTIFPKKSCIRTDWPYVISFKYRINSGGVPYAARVRMDYKDVVTGDWVNGVFDLACPTQSKGQWVTCEMMTVLKMDLTKASDIRINYWTDGVDTQTYNFELDDISFALYKAPVYNEIVKVDNILSPIDLISTVGASTLGTDGVITNAIDGTTNKTNFLLEIGKDTGFDVTPLKQCTVATGIKIFAANDRYGSDPSRVILLGSNGGNWTKITDQIFALPQDRNALGLPLTDNLKHRLLTFTNTKAFKVYRVLFPEIKKIGDSTLHIAEVQIQGQLCPASYLTKTAPPAIPDTPRLVPNFDTGSVANVAHRKPAWQSTVTAGCDASKAVDGNINPFTSGLSVALTGAGGATWEVNLGSEYEIQSVAIWKRMDSCCLNLLAGFAVEFLDTAYKPVHVIQYRDAVPNDMERLVLNTAAAKVKAQYVAIHAWSGNALNIAEVQVFAPIPGKFVDTVTAVGNILSPSDIVTGWGRKNTESPDYAIDGKGNKLTVDLVTLKTGMKSTNSFANGAVLEIVPAQSSCTTAKGLRVYPADRDETTDPTSFKLEGLGRYSGQWEVIAQGPLALPSSRNALGNTVPTSFQYIPFVNNVESYYQYRLSFPTNKGGSWTQIGEVMIPGELCKFIVATPAPTRAPTKSPTRKPTRTPTSSPTRKPTKSPTGMPTRSPTSKPTWNPTKAPTEYPTASPSYSPTNEPTMDPTSSPTSSPTAYPTKIPTMSPTVLATMKPTQSPTKTPTEAPTIAPTFDPTNSPSGMPTSKPTRKPTSKPTRKPTTAPSLKATSAPTKRKTLHPTSTPTHSKCFDLIYENNGAEKNPFSIAPFRATSSTSVTQVASESNGNHYFSIQKRTAWSDGLFLLSSSACVRNDIPYHLHFRYRMHSNQLGAARVRLDYRKLNGTWVLGVFDREVS